MTAVLRSVDSLVLMTVFAWAGVVKILRPAQWRGSIRVYRLARPARALAMLVLPPVELGVAILVATGSFRLGGALALGLMAGFCVAIGRARILQSSNRLPCGCFGGLAPRDYRIYLARNAAIGALAVTIAAWGSEPLISPRAQAALLGALTLLSAAWVGRQLGTRMRQRDRAPRERPLETAARG